MAIACLKSEFDYSQIDPLDWFQWRAFLWKALAGADVTDPGFWKQAAATVAALCPGSELHSGQVYERAFHCLQQAGLVNGENRMSVSRGMQIWSDSLYDQVPRLLGVRPLFMNLGYAGDNQVPVRALEACDEPYRMNVQLYEQALGGTDLHGRRVLEI